MNHICSCQEDVCEQKDRITSCTTHTYELGDMEDINDFLYLHSQQSGPVANMAMFPLQEIDFPANFTERAFAVKIKTCRYTQPSV